MNTKILLAVSALWLSSFSLAVHAADGMDGMDMGGMKMSQKPGAAPLSVTTTVNPAAPRTGDNTLDLTILDSGGKPATGLKLTTSVAMTSMDMGTTHPVVTETGSGHYTVKVNFSMNGPWRVVVRSGATKVAVLDFEAGAKTPWQPEATKPADQSVSNGSASSMEGMDMKGMKMEEMTGIADMKTATMPQLQEQGTYTATGDENWEKQTGFGHNAGMVAMMNQMMVGGSGMEGMKMPAMNMKFDEQNYAKPDADEADSNDSMPGMDMSGGKAADKKAVQGGMAGMKMNATPPAAKPDAPASDGKAMPGMTMAAPTTGGGTPSASAPVKITATMASTPKAGDNSVTLGITDAQGKPVTGATITMSVAMTSMDMGTTHPAVTEKGAGQYATVANFSMAGPWRVKVKVTAPGQKPQTKAFDFSAK